MDFREDRSTVAVTASRSVTAIKTFPIELTGGWMFIYAPGAGSGLDDGFGKYLAGSLAVAGIPTVRFQFPYAEMGRSSPDSPVVLEATWSAVINRYGGEATNLVIGGRSMGGRFASRVVAQGAKVDALTLFAYPLHPPGDRSNWRIEHFPNISVPTLLCSGTRDSFGSPGELKQAVSLIGNATLNLIAGVDHGFSPLKSSGRTREDVWRAASKYFLDWLLAAPVNDGNA